MFSFAYVQSNIPVSSCPSLLNTKLSTHSFMYQQRMHFISVSSFANMCYNLFTTSSSSLRNVRLRLLHVLMTFKQCSSCINSCGSLTKLYVCHFLPLLLHQSSYLHFQYFLWSTVFRLNNVNILLNEALQVILEWANKTAYNTVFDKKLCNSTKSLYREDA